MALTAQFTIGSPCGGDAHFTVTLAFTPGPTLTFPITKPDVAAPLTAEERAAFVRVLLKIARLQMMGSTVAQIKAAVEAKIWDFTVEG